MTSIDPNTMVDIVFQLRWKSETASHTECYQASQVNMWRDIFPPQVKAALMGKQPGDQISEQVPASDFLSPSGPVKQERRIRDRLFQADPAPHQRITPRVGRFYPKGFLREVPGIFPENREPFRVTGMKNGHMEVDLRHPLAGRQIQVSTVVGKVETKNAERGGSCTNWLEAIAMGPGMQARWQGKPTDFFSGMPFLRDDESEDPLFYQEPRLTQHLDDTALQVVEEIYGRHLEQDMAVLDLMGSWRSHVPGGLSLKRLTGLGLNNQELERNPQLTDALVYDLNRDPQLPFAAGTFDAVICTVSVEYLTQPLAVFKDVSRILKPGGVFVVTFSNRWFPPKVVRVWKEIHEFERMGLVSEYFFSSGEYKNIETWSMRGLPRPMGDKYYHDYDLSDPVYAVWGHKA